MAKEAYDRLGKNCSRCNRGTYEKVFLWDEQDASLHCNNDHCHQRVLRHPRRLTPKEKGAEPLARQAS